MNDFVDFFCTVIVWMIHILVITLYLQFQMCDPSKKFWMEYVATYHEPPMCPVWKQWYTIALQGTDLAIKLELDLAARLGLYLATNHGLVMLLLLCAIQFLFFVGVLRVSNIVSFFLAPRLIKLPPSVIQLDREALPDCFCLQDVQVGQILRQLRCGHRFHQCCVDPWLHQNPTCPLCRQPINNAAPLIFRNR